jgi:hypothetical protein
MQCVRPGRENAPSQGLVAPLLSKILTAVRFADELTYQSEYLKTLRIFCLRDSMEIALHKL